MYQTIVQGETCVKIRKGSGKKKRGVQQIGNDRRRSREAE